MNQPGLRTADAGAGSVPATAAHQRGFTVARPACDACHAFGPAQEMGKDDLLAMLVHELRGPLAPIVTAAALLCRLPDSTARVRRAARIIERQSAQLAALLDDLLDVTRSGDRRLVFRPRKAALRDIIDMAVETAAPIMATRQHELVVERQGLDATVLLDPMRVAQIVSNLLINAAKYTAPGGRVVLNVSPAPGELVLSVADNGVGISSEDQLRLFDLYAQVPGQHGVAPPGFGIGLAVVNQLAALHGGTVSVSSAGAGSGSTFTVRLPLPPDAVPDAEPASAPASATDAVRAAGLR